MEIIKKISNTTIIIDTSYVENRTEAQEKIDKDMLNDAVWAMYDEMEEAV